MNIALSQKQTIAYQTLKQDMIDELLYGGAKGGGKSYFLCLFSALESLGIIKQCNIQRQEKPIPVGFIGRKIAKHFKETTLNTWFKSVDPKIYRIVGNPEEIIILDRVKIYTGGLDNRDAINKFNSAELAFYCIDQAEETVEDEITVLRAAAHNRLIINGHRLKGKGLFTANPAQCWLKEEFIINPTPNRKFIQALPGDNPYLDHTYVETLKDAFRHRPEMLQAYLYGSWNSFEGADQVIKELWIRNAFSRSMEYSSRVKEFIVIDCARFGDDECVIYLMNNINIKQKIVMPYCKTTEISSRAAVLSKQNHNCTVVVESLGADLGAGVTDELRDLGVDVVEFNPAKPSTRPDEYYSLRCEAWHNAAIILCSGILDRDTNTIVIISEHKDDENSEYYGMDYTTIVQLCSPHYKWRGGKLVIEPKDETKARLGRSPDHADPFIIAIWAWPLIKWQDEINTGYRERRFRRHEAMSAMDC